jgi:hypothetical protein
MTYADIVDLPEPIRAALKAVGYGRSNIRVFQAPTVQLGDAGPGNGRRAFTALVNLTTGEHVIRRGSWGGVNMFDQANAVDNDHGVYTLPANGVAIRGSEGYGPVFAALHVGDANALASPRKAVTAEPTPKVELDALYAHGCIKGGQYRRDELRRRNVPAEVVDDLVARGLLSRNKAGATAITTAGRNALGEYRGY